MEKLRTRKVLKSMATKEEEAPKQLVTRWERQLLMDPYPDMGLFEEYLEMGALSSSAFDSQSFYLNLSICSVSLSCVSLTLPT